MKQTSRSASPFRIPFSACFVLVSCVLLLSASAALVPGGAERAALRLPTDDAEPVRPLAAEFRADPAAAAKAAAAVTAANYPDADTVVVDDRIHTRYEADGSETTWDDEWVKCLTEKGRRDLSSVETGFSLRYGDGAVQTVEILGTNGELRVVDFAKTLKIATDNGGMDANIYDPLDKALACAVPGLAIGETRHVITVRRTLKPRMKDTWGDLDPLEGFSPIVQTMVTVDQPAGRPLAHAFVRHPFSNTVTHAADRALAGGRTLSTWTARDVPQAFPEPDMPALWMEGQGVIFSTAKDWPTVSRWYWALCLPRLQAATSGMTNKVHELVKDLATDEEKIRALFRFVSQEVRYMGVTVEDVAPGYEPHDVGLTFENRYGVCRDKAALLVAMLRVAGFKAFPVLISVGPKMDPVAPLPYFNHAIVAVEADPTATGAARYRLMDPTNEHARDLFPAYLSDRSFLVARAEGEGLLTAPVTPAAKNLVRVSSVGTLSADGAVVLSSVIDFEGINDSLYRGALLRRSPDERRRLFEAFVRKTAPGAELLSLDIVPAEINDTETPLSARLTARLPDIVLRGKTRDSLSIPFLSRNIGYATMVFDGDTSLEKRRFPLHLDMTAGSEETVTLKLGDAVGPATSVPEDVSIGAGTGYTCHRRFEVKDGTLAASRSVLVDAVEFDPAAYLQLRENLKAAETAARPAPLFAARALANANVVTRGVRRATRLFSPTAWVTTNSWTREVLTYDGKKSSAELKFGYNPAWQRIEIVAATVSNRDGRVHAVTPREINEMDAGWTALAPRYPAARTLVVSLPAVEIGSVIRVTTAITVTGAPVPYAAETVFDSDEPLTDMAVSLTTPADLKLAVRTLNFVGGGAAVSETNGLVTYVWRADHPKTLAKEPSRPPAALWRPTVVVSAMDWKTLGHRLANALEDARDAAHAEAKARAKKLVKGLKTDTEKVAAIRNDLARHVRIVGPDLYDLPFATAFFAPDRVLADSYASEADYINTLATMLDAAGFDPEIVLAAGDAHGYPALMALAREVPDAETFSTPLVRVKADGAVLCLGAENQYTPVTASAHDDDTFFDPAENRFDAVRVAAGMAAAASTKCVMTVRENGTTDFDYEQTLSGAGVGGFRKNFGEMLPEERSRSYRALLGKLAQNASATKDLVTDTTGYPARMTFSAIVPEFATIVGDTATVRIPDFDDAPFNVGGPARETPIAVGGADASTTEYEIVLPAGYTEVEHLPAALAFDPRLGAGGTSWLLADVKTAMRDGRLVVTVTRRTPARGPATVLPADAFPLLRDWNRAACALANRTVVARKPARK